MKKHILFLAAFLCLGTIFAEPVELLFKMEDGTFEKQIIDSSDEIYTFVWTDFPINKKIIEMSGFEKCTNLKNAIFYHPNYYGDWDFLSNIPNLKHFGIDSNTPSLKFIENLENLESFELDITVEKSYYESLKKTKIDLKKLRNLKEMRLWIFFTNETKTQKRMDFIPPFVNVQNKPELMIYDNRIEKISKEEIKLLKQYSKVSLNDNPIANSREELLKLEKAKINFSARPMPERNL